MARSVKMKMGKNDVIVKKPAFSHVKVMCNLTIT
jgi:hypothetical protein